MSAFKIAKRCCYIALVLRDDNVVGKLVSCMRRGSRTFTGLRVWKGTEGSDPDICAVGIFSP